MAPNVPVEAEYTAASRTRLVVIGIVVCVAIGIASTAIGAAVGQLQGLAYGLSFIAVPTIMLMFLAVREQARTPTVIVSDRGLELSKSDETRVTRWADIAAVELGEHDGEARIRFITHARLEGSVAHLIDAEAASEGPDASPDVERMMRAESTVLADLARYGTELPPIPAPRGYDAIDDWDPLLTRFAGDRYRGVLAE